MVLKLNLDIILDCKTHRISLFVLNATIWLMLVPLWCSFKTMFFTYSVINIPAYIFMPLFISFRDNITYLLTACDTVSFSTTHILQSGDSVVLSLSNFTQFVFTVYSWALTITIRGWVHSFILLFLCHFHALILSLSFIWLRYRSCIAFPFQLVDFPIYFLF